MAGDYTYLIHAKAGYVDILEGGVRTVSGSFQVMFSVATNPRYKIRKRAESGEAYCIALIVCADELMERGLVNPPQN